MKETDELISIIRSTGQGKSSGGLDEASARRIACGLFSYRGIENSIASAPKHFFETLFSLSKSYGSGLLPFDPIDLRDILEDNTICHSSPLILFSQQAAASLIKAYKCFLIIDISEFEDCLTVGGATLFKDCHINVKDKITGILINRQGPEKQVRNIVADINPSIPVHNQISPPGLERLKVAQYSGSKKKYLINLPALRIVEEIVAENEFDAVKRALALRWDRHPDSSEKRKPARYSAEYWLHSGFWNTIVKEAKSETIVRTAQGPNVSLTPEEQQVFSTLLAIDRHFGLGQQYRVAGGWVRDRLLGTQSDDIDIALDKMTGQEFRKYAEEFAKLYPESGIGKSYVVDQNPDASKHLETTAIQFGPFKIDFVNLRTEDYASDSRIPEMRHGTPQEDASRRDLTINALFYNIGTGEVEDFVGGLEDLKTLTLRTPLDPTQTFLDDPLRMLRVLRFHSRYEGSNIAPETLQGMSDPRVHDAYRTKVSPERAGPEIMKMFNGATPEESLRILYETGMYSALLNMPEFEGLNEPTMDQRNPNHQLNWLEHTLRVVKNLNDIMAKNGIEGKDRSLALIASWFHDFGKLHPDIAKPKEDNPDHMTYRGHEDVSAELSEKFLKSIGIGGDDRQIVNMIVQQHMYPHSHGSEWGKRQMGKLREKSVIPGQENRSDLWKFVMWHAQADAASKSQESKIEDFPEYDNRFVSMEEYMSAPPPMKPLVDGRRLMEIFPNISPKTGFIKDIHTRLLDEQGAGNIADASQAESFVESLRADIESRYGGGNTMSSNWYKNVKLADASSASMPGGYNQPSQSAEPEATRHNEQKKMIYYNPGENSRFNTGDRVRSRKSGLAFPQREGKIVRKKENRLLVRWDGGEESEFDVNEIETHALIERV